MKRSILRKSANWRIVIPNLIEYKNSTPEQLYQLKCLILHRLRHRPQQPQSRIKSQFDRGLRYYHIALERHANEVPHFDILLIYNRSIQRQLVDYDYLLKHGNITIYRKLNQAILDYGKKEDKQALSNLPEDQISPDGSSVSSIIRLQNLKSDPYSYLYNQMCKDPLHFNVQEYVKKHQISQYIKNWSATKTKLKDMQVAAANLKIKDKPGFRVIDKTLLKQTLTDKQHRWYTKNRKIYGKIVEKLNEIVANKGGNRPFKSKQLLLVGPPDTGKTSLIRQIQKHTAVYHMDVSNWFPAYQDGIYPVISWNEFKLRGGMPHTDLLKFLEGYPMDLQYKGGSSLRRDNQLIIMTSNMTLDQHIDLKFKDQKQRSLARQNLRARIEQVIIPKNVDLFVLLRLIQGF